MGVNFETARALARGWWELDVAQYSRQRGYGICAASSRHQIPIGGGCLCNPVKRGDKTPDLVCEACFEQLPYEPWDGSRTGTPSSPYQTVDEALESVGKRVVRPVVATPPEPPPPPPPRGLTVRALLACLIVGGSAGAALAAGLARMAETRPEAAKDGLLVGLACGLAAWLVGLLFRRVDLIARGRGGSVDRPEAAWRLTPLAAGVGAVLAVLAPTLVNWLIGQAVYREDLAPYSERLARSAADPLAALGLGIGVTMVLATLLPWARANLRGLGRGLGAVDGLARIGALLGAIVAGAGTAALLTVRPDLALAEPGRAAPWVVYVAPVIGFLVGAWPRNALVRGVAGAAFGYALLGVLAGTWRPEFEPSPLLDRLAAYGATDPRTWSESSQLAACLGLPILGALLGAALSRTLLSASLVLVAATLAGCWAVIALAALMPEVATRAPGALENVLTDVPAGLGMRTVLLGALAGLFAVGGASLGFRRGAIAAILGLGIAYGLAYLGFVVIWPLLAENPTDLLGDGSRRAWRWAGIPALALAPLAGYLLGRGRFSALVAGTLGYALGLLVALPAAEAMGIDVGSALSQELGVKPVIWPALLAIGGVTVALGVILALVLTSARRRWALLKYRNKFECGWCGRRSTRDVSPVAKGPTFPVCGDPLCEKELGRLLANPTVRSLVDGPLRSVSMTEAPELPESIQELASPGRIERLRRLAQSYRPAEA
ncbi:MAG: hypothetical protein AB7I30_22715 [Isosphaeraceae bacterium]